MKTKHKCDKCGRVAYHEIDHYTLASKRFVKIYLCNLHKAEYDDDFND